MEPTLLAKHRTRLLVLLYILAALWGVRAGLLPRTRQLSGLLLGLGSGVGSVLLLSTDARLRGKPLPSQARWLMIFVWPAALAI